MSQRLSLFIIVLGLLLVSVVAAEQQKTGTLSLVWGDSLGQHDSDHQRFLFSERASGQVYEVDIDASQLTGGVNRWDRSFVSLQLDPAKAQRGRVVPVKNVSMLRPAVAEKSVSGSQPWVTLLCKFADKADEPSTTAAVDQLFGTSAGELDHYWQEVSHGAVDLDGSMAAGWFTMSGSHADYVPTPGEGINADIAGILNDCIGKADPFVDFSQFVGVNFFVNDIMDCCAYGSGFEGTIDGVQRTWYATWVPVSIGLQATLIAHEMGHGFGLPHGNNFDGDENPYDSPWDVMSGAYRFAVSHPDYLALGKHTNTYHKDFLGWIAPELQFIAGDDTDEVVTLDHPVLGSTPNYRMARIPISDTKWYTVEARVRTGNYEASLPGDGVIINEVDTGGRPEPSWVVDGDIPPADIGDTDGSLWTVGETFQDLQNGISISVEQETTNGFDVRIFVGTLPTIFTDGFELGNTSAWSTSLNEAAAE